MLQLLTPELIQKLAVACHNNPQAFEQAVQKIKTAAAAISKPITPTTASTIASTIPSTTLEEQVVVQLNLCRTDPKAFALKMKETAQYYDGLHIKRPNETTLVTNEGIAALNECIEVLNKTTPMAALTLPMQLGLCQSAKSHNDDTGPSGTTGHAGSDGSQPADRMNRYGLWSGGCAENISYGHSDPFRIVEQLLRDDGVSSRGHRTNILTSSFTKVGVAISDHKTYNKMCTQNFANEYKDGAADFDRSQSFQATATKMNKEIEQFLTIVPFVQIVEKIKNALKDSTSNTVSINYNGKGTLAVEIKSKGGSSSFNCTFG